MSGTDDSPGVLQMASEEIFDLVMAKQNRQFLIRVSYLEIYNETVRDLLTADPERSTVQIREDPRRGVFVEATERIIGSLDDIYTALANGNDSRHVGATNMNERSSRSHTIFRITVESRLKASDDSNDDDDDESGELDYEEDVILSATLNLVDLAGSESVKHTGATGQRLKEGGKINQSLLSLSRVIYSLSSAGNSHINFRDSKLTRLLQPSLGGNSKISVICCITPSSAFLEDSKSTLQFASRAKLVTISPEVNEILCGEDNVSEEELINLRKEIRRLKQGEKEWDEEKKEQQEKIERLKNLVFASSHLPVAMHTSSTDTSGEEGSSTNPDDSFDLLDQQELIIREFRSRSRKSIEGSSSSSSSSSRRKRRETWCPNNALGGNNRRGSLAPLKPSWSQKNQHENQEPNKQNEDCMEGQNYDDNDDATNSNSNNEAFSNTSELEGMVETLSIQIETLEAQLEDKDMEIQKLRDMVDSQPQQTATAAAMQEEGEDGQAFTELQAKVQSLEAERDEMLEELKEMGEELLAMEETTKKELMESNELLKIVDEECEIVKEEKQELELKNKAMEEEIAEMKRLVEEASSSSSSVDAIEVEELKEELENYKLENQQLTASQTSFQQQLDEWMAYGEMTRVQMQAKEQEFAAMQASIDDLAADRNEQKVLVQQTKEAMAQLEEELVTLREQEAAQEESSEPAFMQFETEEAWEEHLQTLTASLRESFLQEQQQAQEEAWEHEEKPQLLASLTQLEGEKEELATKVQTLEQQLQEQQASLSSIARLTSGETGESASVEHLEHSVKQLQTKYDLLVSEKEGLEATVEELEQEIQESENESRRREEELEKEIQTLQDQMEGLEKQHSHELRETSDQSLQRLQECEALWTEKVEKIRGEHATDMEQLKEDLDLAIAAADAAQEKQEQEKEEEEDEEEATCEQCEHLTASLDELNVRFSRKADEAQQLLEDNERYLTDIEKLQEEMAAMTTDETLIEEMNTMLEQRMEMEAKNEALSQSVIQLKKELESYETRSIQDQRFLMEAAEERLSTQREELSEKICDLSSQLAASKNLVEEKENLLEDLQRLMDEKEAMLSEMQDDLFHTQKEIEDLKARYEEAVEQASDMSEHRRRSKRRGSKKGEEDHEDDDANDSVSIVSASFHHAGEEDDEDDDEEEEEDNNNNNVRALKNQIANLRNDLEEKNRRIAKLESVKLTTDQLDKIMKIKKERNQLR
jgi:chromosome segregation ATPase